MMYDPPPGYPRASSSPTIIVLVAGLTGVLGFLIGFLTGLGSGELAAAPAPRVTVTVEERPSPDDTEPTDPAASDPAASDPAVPDPGTSDPAASDPAASDPAASDPASDPSASSPAASVPATPDPGDPLASMRTLVVGVDIQPGTYRTTGPAGGGGQCYWARMKSATGGLADVIDAGMPTGPATVTVLATDKSFQTAGCADWTRA
ncbi:hypothetical protein OUY22_26560 [Nonomuraea sp. MCN248]|uniref:Uncharacterized protein n=1 Tax=Nonomuraea corallina TaxID=2989783 RepID=A0ABT4SJ88_9ACTN|nr:hypothetical protein [Nonomuraea corallina]MDA0636986.1 hypothetical protein [Nonomuraea corallina]